MASQLLSIVNLGMPGGIYFSQCKLEDCEYIDVGKSLCETLAFLDPNSDSFAFEAEESLDSVIQNRYRRTDSGIGYLALDNVEMLFEPSLRFNVRALLERYGKNTNLIIHSKGQIEESTFYPFPGDSDYAVDLTGLPVIRF